MPTPLSTEPSTPPQPALLAEVCAVAERHDLWVIDEHLVAKTPAVPGTGCLEMARAAFVLACGEGPVERLRRHP